MYGLTRFNHTQTADPFAELARNFFGVAPVASPQAAVAAHTPRFDFIESADSYVLRGDLPGIKDEDLEITVHEGILTVSGTRAEETLKEDSQFVVRERRYGEFSRRLKLPKNADADQVEAKLEHGVLTVSIGKKQELQARRIKVS